jgi:hypothetical protein
MDKELHNRDINETPADDKRIAFGSPGVESENMTIAGLKAIAENAALGIVGTSDDTLAAGNDDRFPVALTDLSSILTFSYTGWTISAISARYGRIVIISFSITVTAGEQQNIRQIGIIPEGNRPAYGPIRFTLNSTDNTNTSGGFGYINTDGTMNVMVQNNAISYVGTCIYFT